MIRGSDGLDYEDLNARLLGEPADTGRNSVLGPNSNKNDAFKADYRETYDHYEAAGYPPWECHNCAIAQADFSQQQRIDRARDEIIRAVIDYAPYRPPIHGGDDRIDAVTYGILTLYSGEPPGGGPGGAGSPSTLQAALATLRAAPEPPVRRGLGPQGHLSSPGEVQRRRGEGSQPPADDPDAATAREV